jgi:inner membrane protein
MPTIITHSVAALAVGKVFAPTGMPTKFWLLTAACVVLPDIDVISFAFGIRYDEMLGHRGLTHSIPFAVVIAFIIVLLFFREKPLFSITWWALTCYFFGVTASHAALDAMTNGGLGVAFFAPFTNERYFFPYRPISVSPIGIEPFFQARGLAVLWNEIKWIWFPSMVMVIVAWIVRRVKLNLRTQEPQDSSLRSQDGRAE